MAEVTEAKLTQGDVGLAPEGDGWFVVNIADSQGLEVEEFGKGAMFEAQVGDFPQFGINVRVLEPGKPASRYHRENRQEAFLVLAGECVAVVEEEERTLRKGDFLYTPPGVAHAIIGAGDRPSSVLMVGSRVPEIDAEFPFSEVAARYGASVDADTTDPAQANAGIVPRPSKIGDVPW